jgi:hypothetical protein
MEVSTTMRTKYPKTMHLPWSPNLQNDDRLLETTDVWNGVEVVITEKMDGENTSMYPHSIHARSMDSSHHLSRAAVKGIWGSIRHRIPEDYRICGENMYAKHSIGYDNLDSYFLVFNIWDANICLDWRTTTQFCDAFGLYTVPVLYIGLYSDELCQELCSKIDLVKQEGLVVRPTAAFGRDEFETVVGKFVRKGHVQTDEHWLSKPIEVNGVKA